MTYLYLLQSDSPITFTAALTNDPTPVTPPPVIVTPLPAPPPEDNTPFVWPVQPYWPGYDGQREYALRWSDGTRGTIFVALPGVSNPLPASHRFAGYIVDPTALRAHSIPPDAVALWAPYIEPPAIIRRVLAGGEP
jgi:hypothetical protein